MTTITKEKAEVAAAASEEDERYAAPTGEDDALLTKMLEYVRVNGLEPEILRIAGEESRRNGTDRLTSEEIDHIIQLARADRKR